MEKRKTATECEEKKIGENTERERVREREGERVKTPKMTVVCLLNTFSVKNLVTKY